MAHFYNTCSDSITDNVSLTYITCTLIHRGNMDIKDLGLEKMTQKSCLFFIKQHTEHQTTQLVKIYLLTIWFI